ncbi:hypothetical protein AB0A69_27495 [Streptomyces sp. NPDC045431]|uniref:hypothetical protein n=1 Tax=Streptomyces sp. NPDC045431 TaxID=3155613 RepID=UPI0033EC8223
MASARTVGSGRSGCSGQKPQELLRHQTSNDGQDLLLDVPDPGPASTGGGKSATLRCIACQVLHHGSLVFVLDTKRISHPWARGTDGVTYCRDIADIHDQLIELGQIGRLRTRIADELGIDADPKAISRRLLILLEEINATMKQLARYWEKIRASGDPKVSPAVDALNEILYMGRQLRMDVLLVAQSATARALGGPEVRKQFATRILARYSMNAWRMLDPRGPPGTEVNQAPRPRLGCHRRHRPRDQGAALHRDRSPRVGHHRQEARRRPEPRSPPGAARPRADAEASHDRTSSPTVGASSPRPPTRATPPQRRRRRRIPPPVDDDQAVGLR